MDQHEWEKEEHKVDTRNMHEHERKKMDRKCEGVLYCLRNKVLLSRIGRIDEGKRSSQVKVY